MTFATSVDNGLQWDPSSKASVALMHDPHDSGLSIAPTKTGYLVTVAGQGTACVSQLLHERAAKVLQEEGCRLAVDLSGCDYLDSTFLGCLADLNKRFGGSKYSRFAVAGPRDHCKTLFGTTRLEMLIPIVNDPPAVTGEPEVIPLKEAKRRDLGRHVMQSHQRLADLEGPDQAVFSAIAEEIANELGEASRPRKD